MVRLILAGIALLLAQPARADEDCSGQATQLEMNACASRNFDAADAALNAAYREIVSRLGGDEATRVLLRDAQRAWVTFRDAECRFSTSGVAGGSIHPLIYATCLADVTAARTAILRGYLDCREGDLACPVPPR